jgi:hypothetical protein
MQEENQTLIGSTFPLSLIRRPVVITPEPIETLKAILQQNRIASFWGHQNTVQVANQFLGVEVNPPISRPALMLTSDNFPALDGRVYNECWILSPEYRMGYRPGIGEEVSVDKISGWQVLRIKWLEKHFPDL